MENLLVQDSRTFWTDAIPALILLILTTVLVMALFILPRDNGQLFAVFFPPQTQFIQAYANIINAGGQVVRSGAKNFIIVAHSDDKDFIYRAYKHGAILVADPVMAGSCVKNTSKQTLTFSNTRKPKG